MADLSHVFGNDLTIDATGDLAVSDGSQMGEERVLRRLLTNPGNYIWQLDYGAGLARFLGQPASASRISAVTLGQMMLEAVVARTPTPAVTVSIQPDGTVTETIRYVDADTGESVSLPPVSIGAVSQVLLPAAPTPTPTPSPVSSVMMDESGFVLTDESGSPLLSI